MKPEELLEILTVAERLKCNTRHSYTSSGRHESVAEHSWRIALMAMLLEREFSDLDMNKVIKMCLIHDLGEAFTGDIPSFDKTQKDSEKEDEIFEQWVEQFPVSIREDWKALLQEMKGLQTKEARLYKAFDKIEAVIQHDEANIATWLPLEYELQLTYGQENMQDFEYMKALRMLVDQRTREKIKGKLTE